MTCTRAKEFLSREKIDVKEVVDAKKKKIGPSAAVKLARSVDRIWVAKGKKVAEVDMKGGKVSDSDLKALLLGPSGNLRAPTLRRGNELFVGFHPEEFAKRLS
jgi:arsenate reductase-like glutaredoxin family protein